MPPIHRLRPPSVRGGFALVFLILAVAGVVARWWVDEPRRRLDREAVEAPATGRISGHARIVDGDGLEIAGLRLRLVGIDAPELAQLCRLGGRDEPCGETARERLGTLVGGRGVACDWGRRDKWGRPLARCRVGETDLGAAMVRDGWAVAYGGHEAEESEARTARRGLWAGTFDWPEDWRRAHPRGRSAPFFWSWWAEEEHRP